MNYNLLISHLLIKGSARLLTAGKSACVIADLLGTMQLFANYLSYVYGACRTPDEMRGKLSVQFHSEEGIDAGGVTREWYQVPLSAADPITTLIGTIAAPQSRIFHSSE